MTAAKQNDRATAPVRAQPGWPPVVVAGSHQTGVCLMRDMSRRGVTVYCIDCFRQPGFQTVYGKAFLCPNPDKDPAGWVRFMVELATRLGCKPVIVPIADIFVAALGTHAAELRDRFTFSAAAPLQAELGSKESQYRLANELGLPCPRTVYIESAQALREFAAAARFPCLLKPRSHREWDELPAGHPFRGQKLVSADSAEKLQECYQMVEPHQPCVMAQEVIVGGEDAKYCYLSVYGRDGARLGYVVVREFRGYPVFFGSASIVEPVVDEEIAGLCDAFLRKLGYAGICEIEVKRDERDRGVRLVEVNPRFSGTGDCAIYTGVDMGWLHYLDLIGEKVAPVEATRFGFKHITLIRDIPAFPQLRERGLITWKEWLSSYRPPVVFYDFDWRDWRVTGSTLYTLARFAGGRVLRRLHLKSTTAC